MNTFPTYHRMVKELLRITGAKNITSLCKLTGIEDSVFSNMLSGKSQISAGTILRLHEITHIPVAQIRELCNRPLGGYV
jgi:hypothetical protein